MNEQVNERELQADVRAADEAAQVLDNEAFHIAFEKLEQDYVTQLLASGVKDDEQRYRWQVAVNVLRGVKAHLHGVLNDGQFAKVQLADIAKVQPLRRRKIF